MLMLVGRIAVFCLLCFFVIWVAVILVVEVKTSVADWQWLRKFKQYVRRQYGDK